MKAVILLLLCCVAVMAQYSYTVPALEVATGVSGRWRKDGSVVVFDWPCVQVKTTFSSGITGISVVLNGGLNNYLVMVDSNNGTLLPTTSHQQTYKIASDLDGRVAHTIIIMKANEASSWTPAGEAGPARLYAFLVDSTSPSPPTMSFPTRPSRRIEVFGDSDSNGFGILSGPSGPASDAECLDNIRKYSDCVPGYDMQLSQALNAEIHIEAWSGKGIVKNAVGVLGPPMPHYWNMTVAKGNDSAADWDFTRWVPDVVVVYLGSNDYNTIPPSHPQFLAAYTRLLTHIVASYQGLSPFSTIINLCGGSGSDAAPCSLVKTASEQFASTFKRSFYVLIPTSVNNKTDYGCLGHRNVLGQTKLATFLEPQFRSIMGWN